MSRFYASIKGLGRTEATRRGSANSNIRGHIRGWDLGVEIVGYNINNGNGGDDAFNIFITSGSNRHRSEILLGYVRELNGRVLFVPNKGTLNAKEVELWNDPIR